MLPDKPLMEARPIYSGCVCPHPEGRDCGLAHAQHRAEAAQLAGENTLTRDPRTRVQVPTLPFIDCMTLPSLSLSLLINKVGQQPCQLPR